MNKIIGLLISSSLVACTSHQTAPERKIQPAHLSEGICAKPDQRNQCVELLRAMASEQKWGLFEASFKEFCTQGGAKCQLASNLKPGSRSPFAFKAAGDGLFHQRQSNGEETYYFFSKP